MQLYPETKRLKEAQSTIGKIRFNFGPNKRQEIVRLVYEISKRDNISCSTLLREAIENCNLESAKHAFSNLKNYLLRLRFPMAYPDKDNSIFYLPKISLENKNVVGKNNPKEFYPTKIFVEKEVMDYKLTREILDKFPKAKCIEIKLIKDYQAKNKHGTSISKYNSRANNLFLVKERFDFIKPCPCSKKVLGCGYYVLNLGFGCMYECDYCFLQAYTNVSGIVLPVNIDDYLKKLDIFLKNKKISIRIGTGEFSDSLALDNLTGYAKILIEYFSDKNAILELKTKSNNIKHLLSLKHDGKTVISWSVNPQSHIDSDEWFTASLEDRIKAAKECLDAGYKVGFHFDPIIYSDNWQALYKNLVEDIFSKVDVNRIAWISLGTFRFPTKLKRVIEQRFPRNKILDQELLLGFDDKLRYHQKTRLGIYKKMFSWIRSYSKSVLIYLCMEPKDMWREALGMESFNS